MKSFLARLSQPRPLLNGQLIDWLILLLIAAVVAVIVRGWPVVPSASAWGTWGEWAGAVGSGLAAVAAVGVAIWTNRILQEEKRLNGRFEIAAGAAAIAEAYMIARTLEHLLGRAEATMSDTRVAFNKAVSQAGPLSMRKDRPRAETEGDSAARNKASDLSGKLNKLHQDVRNMADMAQSAHGLLESISHVRAAGCDRKFGVHLMNAKSQLTLAHRIGKSSGNFEGMQTALNQAIFNLGKAAERANHEQGLLMKM